MGVRGRQKNSGLIAEWCKTMISRDGYFDLPVTHERFFFLHTLYHIWSQIPLIVDIFHILITFLWCLMTALTSVMLTLTMVYLLIPIQPVHIKSVRNLNFYLTLDNFSFSVCFYNHAIFQYMYLREPVFGQFYHINSGILGRYTWYILGCRMKVHK